MKKIPSPLVSLIPLIVLVALLFATIRTFGSDALSGGSQVSLLTTTAVCVLIGMGFYKIGWKDFELAITNNITGVSSALIILLIIGALSGAWMISGVVPTLIYYGIQIIHPSFFLTSTCIICALVSVMTGSSWTTIATIGIALMGIGKAQGFEEGWIAGAIISGAYFGDKISPLSDTTILAASVTDTPPVQAHPLYADNHCAIINHHLDNLHCSRAVTQCRKYRTYSRVLGSTGRKIPHYAMVADCTDRNRHTDCPSGTFHYHLVLVGSIGRSICGILPTRSIARNIRCSEFRRYSVHL